MSRARQVLPGRFYMLTRRCTQRQFLLRPDEETNNAFLYCLIEAALRFQVDLMMTTAMSNHHHTPFFDRLGNFPAFVEHFHKMLARCMNARWGRWENMWSVEEVCVTRLLDRETIIDKMIYTAANPVKDMLVERAHHWPGANGYVHLIHRTPLRAHRPRHFFRKGGVMPETVEIDLVIPPELGPADDLIAEVKAGVERVEQAMIEHRRDTGKRVLGRRRVLAQSWRDAPTSIEPRRNLRPRFAGRLPGLLTALLEYKAFLVGYVDARLRWLDRKVAFFPPGTYWLAQFAPIVVAC